MLTLSFVNESPGTKTEHVVETIRTAILAGDLLPGTRLTERQVKELLKVSSSPVREAFNQLEAEGLLTRVPHVGAKVTEMDVGDARELYVIQSLLQGTAVQLATKKLPAADIHEAEALNEEMKKLCGRRGDPKALRVANYKLHLLLCGANVYPWLTRPIAALWIRLPTQSYWLIPKAPESSIRQHEQIIRAVRERDALRAGALMRKHLEISMRALYGRAR